MSIQLVSPSGKINSIALRTPHVAQARVQSALYLLSPHQRLQVTDYHKKRLVEDREGKGREWMDHGI